MRSLERLKNYDVVLASGSPRRRELVAMLGVPFRVAMPHVDERWPADLAVEDVPLFLSRLKSSAYMEQLWKPGQLVISADTVVVIDGQILGKPASAEEACRMLRQLSGRTHRVISGVTVTDGEHTESFSDVTEVDFASLTDDEIADYVTCYRPLDKAGAYGIQEWIGAAAVAGIRGSFYNVMGLPVHRLYRLLRSF